MLKLSKLDAAKGQLETAICLWFSSGEPVSIHTLAAAAHQILHDLGKSKGTPTTLRGLPMVRPEYKKYVRKLVSSYENFFKHADSDAADTLIFNPAATEIFIFDAVRVYVALTRQSTPILFTFTTWFLIRNPSLLIMKEQHREKLIQTLKNMEKDVTQMPKAAFFSFVLPLCTSALQD
jgi:hypothetical protein